MKTSELTGAALDWAVATIEGYSNLRVLNGVLVADLPGCGPVGLNYCSRWDLTGPIMEREGISFRQYWRPGSAGHGKFYARVCRESGQMVRWSRETSSTGPTPLIAALRCFVTTKLGPEVEVPTEI